MVKGVANVAAPFYPFDAPTEARNYCKYVFWMVEDLVLPWILSDRTHKKGDGSFYVAWHWGKLDTDEDNQKTTKTESSPRVKVLECLVSDTLFPWNDLQAKLNGEFLNNLGNSVNRALSFIAKHMIMQAEKHPKANALYVEEIDIGGGEINYRLRKCRTVWFLFFVT
ncbi:hypothetical protein ISN45_At05g001690 [Arabidopsis thaliana x Arabidopsis arenosa]|uniref:Uncharacterized protein n=2 Tax=Arabidopsis TaxID=3701 RepID=A0A8T2DC03_ARASU|nr:hypothetical protein ISN45_At05g001690 [Arabidopsis thaliana x Arabidopsis arenosa]KAG7607870.1 hypothetical protein ISN44_As05g001750 [Arabidopsis suecica]